MINILSKILRSMPKWKKGAKEFQVSITENKSSGTSFSYIPKPILDELGEPHSLRFLITRGKIVVEPGDL